MSFYSNAAEHDYCIHSTQQHCQKSPLNTIKTHDLDQYKTWQWLSAFEPSGLHWDQFVSVYINRSSDVYRNNHGVYFAEFMDEEVTSSYQNYPMGVVLVKENYLPHGGQPETLATVTVMIKEQVNNTDSALNWRYQQYTATGQLLINGTADDPIVNASCASCHQNVAERDYIFSTQLSTQFAQ